MKANKKIKEIYNISDESLKRLFWEVGYAFARRNYRDLRIEQKKRFWSVFATLWEADDRAILLHPDLVACSYIKMKAAMIDDLAVFGTFHEAYHASWVTAPAHKGSPINSADKWRKRVMAAIGGYLTLSGKETSAALIKGIACQAAQVGDFNKISTAKLRNLYNSFLVQQNDLKNVQQTIKTI